MTRVTDARAAGRLSLAVLSIAAFAGTVAHTSTATFEHLKETIDWIGWDRLLGVRAQGVIYDLIISAFTLVEFVHIYSS